MSWLLFSLIAPLIWSVVNHAEKVLLARYFQSESVGGVMIFIGLASAPIVLGLAISTKHIFAIDLVHSALLVSSGIFYGLSCYAYLATLQRHDASYVVPLWQLTPVFTCLFAGLFLGEYLAGTRLLGGGVVIAGAVMLCLRRTGRNIGFDLRSLALMTASSAGLALGFVLFKLGGGGVDPIFALCWNQIGLAAVSLAFLLSAHDRSVVLEFFRKNSGMGVALNLGTQVLDVLAVLAANFALRFAPSAMVVLVEYAAQPVFVLLIGVVLTWLAPRIVTEDLSRRSLTQRLGALCVMTFGVWLVLK